MNLSELSRQSEGRRHGGVGCSRAAGCVFKHHNGYNSRGIPSARGIAGRVVDDCFESLDAPVIVVGAKDTPAIPLNEILEKEYLPDEEEVRAAIERVLRF